MADLSILKPERVFYYFDKISSIPRGSGDMVAIADYCEEFAKEHALKLVRDSANNVVIYKNATKGYEKSEPVILQGHLDIVCQKQEGSDFDFLKDGIETIIAGDFVTANGTTLGADNGIAVAMVLAILEDNTIEHPSLEAVFTTDEEIGMIGAVNLDMSVLKGKKMINLDAEEDDSVTVSCAGGRDFRVTAPITREKKSGQKVTITLSGLKGGHSGVEIDKGRVNANILAGRVLNYISSVSDINIISVNGGTKSNAIPNYCKIEFCTWDALMIADKASIYLSTIKAELSYREPDFSFAVEIGEDGEFSVMSDELTSQLVYILTCVPNGVIEMSAEIEGLVESSHTLGILETQETELVLHFSLRSNKNSAIEFLQERLKHFFSIIKCKIDVFGIYPPWEFKSNSMLQEIYKEIYYNMTGTQPKVEAIHAGLECGVFASAIEGLDCIAIGPALSDVHTVNEKLSISSTQRVYSLLLELLKRCK